MNQALTDTNVVLNIAISPSLWLLPSNLILLNKPIPGYNNKLKVSNENMMKNPKRNTKRQYSKKTQSAQKNQ